MNSKTKDSTTLFGAVAGSTDNSRLYLGFPGRRGDTRSRYWRWVPDHLPDAGRSRAKRSRPQPRPMTKPHSRGYWARGRKPFSARETLP